MRTSFIQRLLARCRVFAACTEEELERVRFTWVGPAHLLGMNREPLSGLGLEPMLTTSELADYLDVEVQAIYDLRARSRAAGIRVGRELRYRISDVRTWLDRLHGPEPQPAMAGGEF